MPLRKPKLSHIRGFHALHQTSPGPIDLPHQRRDSLPICGLQAADMTTDERLLQRCQFVKTYNLECEQPGSLPILDENFIRRVVDLSCDSGNNNVRITRIENDQGRTILGLRATGVGKRNEYGMARLIVRHKLHRFRRSPSGIAQQLDVPSPDHHRIRGEAKRPG